MSNAWSKWFGPGERPLIDRYHIAAVTAAGELLMPETLPLEIRFVLAKRPEREDAIRRLLEAGYAIGIRTVDYTPPALVEAVHRIAHLTQENTLIPWLPNLLRRGELPVFTDRDLDDAKRRGVGLYEDARLILDRRHEFKKLVLIDLHNRGLGEDERELIRQLNEELYPFSVDYIVNRVLFDYTQARTEVSQTIIKAMVIVGPITHLLEHLVHGLGKVFAASIDDVMGETAELFSLAGSGFTGRQLLRRSRILIPVFILAVFGALSVEGLIARHQFALGGMVFGLSAVALSLTTAVQSIGMYRQCYERLFASAKLSAQTNASAMSLALRQDFTNPARLGLLVGSLLAPFLAGIVFILFPSLVYNGWVLALLGSIESIVAGLTVLAAKRLNRVMFRSRIRREIIRMASGS